MIVMNKISVKIINNVFLSLNKRNGPSFSISIGSRIFSTSVPEVSEESCLNPEESDMPVSDIPNPFESEKRLCILCKYKIPVDYKNPKLLSQFVSPYTGYIYDKHITGLCDAQQNRMRLAIVKSRQLGYMAYVFKSPKFLKDPKLYDAFKPSRPHPY